MFFNACDAEVVLADFFSFLGLKVYVVISGDGVEIS